MSEWLDHQGHNIVVARYQGTDNQIVNVSIECEDCWEVLADREIDL